MQKRLSPSDGNGSNAGTALLYHHAAGLQAAAALVAYVSARKGASA